MANTLLNKLKGKEVHIRIKTNDLLEVKKTSVVARGKFEGKSLVNELEVKNLKISDYKIGLKLQRNLKSLTEQENNTVVIVREIKKTISPDDVRYIASLANQKGYNPIVYILPEDKEKKLKQEMESKRALVDDVEKEELMAYSFAKRHLIKLKSVPTRVSKDAAIAAVPRTLMHLILIIVLYLTRQDEVTFERFLAYTAVAIIITLGFCLIFQTVLNWMTYWSEFTYELFEPLIKKLEGYLDLKESKKGFSIIKELTKTLLNVCKFISARGDILIAGPLLGIFASTVSRIALGAVGQTASVFTLWGLFLLFANIIVGSIASGPFVQMIAHIRARGAVTERASIYLGIFDTLRMEFGRVADFGYQTLYNVVQVIFGIFFWILMLFADALYKKPDMKFTLTSDEEKELVNIFKEFEAKL
ncbi:MAG: hypothetical protein ABIA04_04710 [Pseudomonadota bacterium]